MFVTVNGARLFFDVDGAGLVPDGPRMRERPTVILVHGGPGADHSLFKPGYGTLTDTAQLVYYDHRGNGRSDLCDPSSWTLDQWGDDLRGLCDALGIVRPIVVGVSFGGFVAQAYATRHPDHAGGLILISTAAQFDFETVYAAFERIGGPEAGQAARAYWGNPTSESRARYAEICLPHYMRNRDGLDEMMSRIILRDPPALHFNGPNNEQGRMDFRAALGRVPCPVLVLAGEDDPITPPEFSETIAASLPAGQATLIRYPDCGHGITADCPDAAFRAMRDFIRAL